MMRNSLSVRLFASFYFRDYVWDFQIGVDFDVPHKPQPSCNFSQHVILRSCRHSMLDLLAVDHI